MVTVTEEGPSQLGGGQGAVKHAAAGVALFWAFVVCPTVSVQWI